MSKKWVKVNWVDQMISFGDEVNYTTASYLERYNEYLKDGGVEVQPADEGWDGYTYEQGRGLFRWKNGGKEFIQDIWPAGESYLNNIDRLVQKKRIRREAEEKGHNENVVRDTAEVDQLKKDIAGLKQKLNIA